MTKPKKSYDTTPRLDPTWYFVTAQTTSTQYFVTAQDKDFTIPRILINKETDVTYLHFAGFFLLFFHLRQLELPGLAFKWCAVHKLYTNQFCSKQHSTHVQYTTEKFKYDDEGRISPEDKDINDTNEVDIIFNEKICKKFTSDDEVQISAEDKGYWCWGRYIFKREDLEDVLQCNMFRRMVSSSPMNYCMRGW